MIGVPGFNDSLRFGQARDDAGWRMRAPNYCLRRL